MLRGIEEIFRCSNLGEFSKIHHGNTVRQVLHHIQIMRNKQIGQMEFLLEVAQQIQDLRRNRHIQSGDGFVTDNEFWVEGQGPRNANPLPLPARKLMRVPRLMFRPQAHFHQQLIHLFLQSLAFGDFMNFQWFADDGANRHSGIQ